MSPTSQLQQAVTAPVFLESLDGVQAEVTEVDGGSGIQMVDTDAAVRSDDTHGKLHGTGVRDVDSGVSEDCCDDEVISRGFARLQQTQLDGTAETLIDAADSYDDLFGRDLTDGYALEAGSQHRSESGGVRSVRELDTERLAEQVAGAGRDGDASGRGFSAQRCAGSLEIEQPKFFWEADPFLHSIFCSGDFDAPSLKRPEPPVDISSQTGDTVWDLLHKAKKPTQCGLCSEVIRHVEARDESDKRASMVSNWSSLVCINLDAFGLGDTLEASGEVIDHSCVARSLEACFARKATSTLSKRFYSMNRFVNFCCRNGLQSFPVREHVVFVYLKHLKDDEKTSPSVGRSLLEAIRFSRGVLGLKSDLMELGSSRVDGLAVELSRRAGPICQAAPLTVQQVMMLEKLVATTEDLKDRATFGSMLVLLYACGRFSDGQRAVQMILDTDLGCIDIMDVAGQGFMELQVLGHKGARTEVLRRTFLPLVSPIYTLAGVDWFRAWIQAREALGLVIHGRLDKPFLCRFGPGGEAVNQELTSAECSLLLRRALKVSGDEAKLIRSHSLKTTPLSWCCKHGLDLSTRRLLGHHLDPSSKSPETYGRDSMAPAVRKLEEVLGDIKSGRFKPDESRSGRFVRAQEPVVETREAIAESSGENSDSDYVPSSSSDSDDSDDNPFEAPSESSLLWHLVVPGLRPGFLDVPDGVLVFRNNVSGVQHLKKPGQMKLLCGRRQSERYTFYAGKPIRGVAMCDSCLGSKELAAEVGE